MYFINIQNINNKNAYKIYTIPVQVLLAFECFVLLF